MTWAKPMRGPLFNQDNPSLIDWAIATARTAGRKELLLSVYIDNHRARRFYERYGFEEIGRYEFRVGETIDDDRIMRLIL